MLTAALSPEEWATLRQSSPAEFHFSAGTQLRDFWSFWEEMTPLRNSFRKLGLSHPDDLSGYLLEYLCKTARDEPFDSDAYIKKVQNHWINTIGRAIP